ncbi:hypothetical protein Tdes44962_MAKER08690 [Teratosphaeria destructans]|uniref:Uncharacterized protein n=1 Tax=Teratosphaeria destructans TaxID=418781 RepID=A0A9W7SW72_9PEZI|nr:hypothetical protein Tdes44962_MAKER08690 [Teratosphaeria destructans]
MPCRVPRACALSTRGRNDCFWITDDLLGDAFDRFLRLSHTNQHPHRPHRSHRPAPGGRRYGSNVPGPMEARRRVARRRMGLMTSAGAAGPPDLGALFGLHARPPVDWETSWKWQPPTYIPTHNPPPPPELPPAAAKETWVSNLLPWARPPVTKKPQEAIARFENRQEDLVAKSKSEFARLLRPLNDLPEITLPDLQPVLDFVQSTQDEPKANNLHMLHQCLEPRCNHIQVQALRALCRLLLDKVKLHTLPDDQILSFLRLSIYRGCTVYDPELCALLAAILDLMSLRRWSAGAVRQLLQPPEGATGSPGVDTATRFLLAILDTSERFSRFPRTSKRWMALYVPLAEALKPLQIANHFQSMSDREMANVLCRFWLSQYMQNSPAEAQSLVQGSRKVMLFLSSQNAQEQRAALIAIWKDFSAMHPDSRAECDSGQDEEEAVEQMWEGLAGGEERGSSTMSDTTTNESYSCKPLVDLLVLLAKHNVHYTTLMSDMFDLFQATRTGEELYELFKQISLHPDLGIPESIAMHRITYFMRPSADADDLTRAFYVFKNVPSISMLKCMDLPLRLIEKGAGYPSFVFEILARRNGQSDVPIDDRQRRKLTLPPAAIDMAHLVAFAYASQEGSIRVAFARVWETYRFLQDRGAPLTPLMSRALVKAGVLRYLKERQRVPLPQLRYVISLVERLEGPDVAATLDRLAFEVWSKKLDLNDPSLPGGGARGLTRMDRKMQNATMWRFKRWSRWAMATSKALRKQQRQDLRELARQNRVEGHRGSSAESKDPHDHAAANWEPMIAPKTVEGDDPEQDAWRMAVDAEVVVEPGGLDLDRYLPKSAGRKGRR